jgi:hypothetical protein
MKTVNSKLISGYVNDSNNYISIVYNKLIKGHFPTILVYINTENKIKLILSHQIIYQVEIEVNKKL